MNHQMQGGPANTHLPPNHHYHPSQRRQDFHPYHTHTPPPHPAPYYPGAYYAPSHQPPPQHYQAQRWLPPQYSQAPPQYSQAPPQQHFIPHAQVHQPLYQPRSPMVVSSQPQMSNMAIRPNFPPHGPPQVTQSPRPVPQHAPQPPPTPASATISSPSPAPIPSQPRLQEQRVDSSPPREASTIQAALLLPPEYLNPSYPNLPWYSVPESPFPRRTRGRRRRRRHPQNPTKAVALPARDQTDQEALEQDEQQANTIEEMASETSTIAAPSEPETPATSQAPSESEYTQASTPATPAQVLDESPKPTPTPTSKYARKDTRNAVAVPNFKFPPKSKSTPSSEVSQELDVSHVADDTTPKAEEQGQATMVVEETDKAASEQDESTQAPPTPKPAPAPKSWAEMARRNAPSTPVANVPHGTAVTNGIQLPKTASLADALKQYNVANDIKLSFLEPRGLVNTGNMCYMNSILQVLVFCTPFYNFLDQVRQRTVQSMKSDTPLVDAMIMFMREFSIIVSAESAGALRSLLKQEQLETYGESLTPEYVYEVIKKLPRFAGMRRGHQQDAEEFLGFLLEGLHDECVSVMRGQAENKPVEDGDTSLEATSPNSADGWLEVGPKQKSAVTRTSGQQDAPTPVTKIFGGHLRSELRVQGQKDSVTLEPYKPLQLDIGAPHVTNIIDALKGITTPESLTGDFGGKGKTAKKQVFVEDLPPVLILHLKRFQYDNNLTGTQKIWKKIGYPLELEIPKEVFAPSKRAGLLTKGLPKYRLTSVVYHHGKSAAGGHYTVDVLRQDSREWVRIDDTIIRRIRPEDVAEGGAEEDPKVLAKALEQHTADKHTKKGNMYQGLDEAEREPEEEKPWNEVNGHVSSHSKKWSGVVNGIATPQGGAGNGKKTPMGVRDNKVAYILLYERIRA